MKKLIWLASYPKSGNTWMRIFLNNLVADLDKPVDINELKQIPFTHGSGRAMFDNAFGFPSSLLSPKELRSMQAEVYRHFAAKQEKNKIVKIHDAFTYSDNKPDFPTEVTFAALYILRNPLEVLCSYAHHRNKPIDDTIECMNDSDHAMAKQRNHPTHQVWQDIKSWSENVESWTAEKDFPLLVIRYEDMQEKTFETFEKVAKFLDFPSEKDRIKKAIEFSAFDKVKKLEEKSAFREKPVQMGDFFRSGKTDGWKETLAEEQINAIIDHHGKTMKKFGYL